MNNTTIFDVVRSKVIDYESAVDWDCDIKAFKTDDFDGLPDFFKKALKSINDMLSLDYMQISENGIMNFTTPGLDYLNRCHQDFVQNIKNSTSDFGIFNGLIDQIRNSESGIDYVQRFNDRCRIDVFVCETSKGNVDYDNAIFGKNKDEEEHMG